MSSYGVASTGYLIGPADRGRGLGCAALRALTDWAFGHGVARLQLETDVDNAASQHVARAAAYRREGVRRGAGARRDGGRRDLVAFARLAGDPAGPVARLLPDLPGGVLSDGVVTLRPLTAEDAASLHRLSGLPDVVATRVPPEAMSEEEARGRCMSAVASQRTLERAGFSREGVQRDLLPNADGTRTDNIMFVRLRADRRQLTSS